MSSLLNDFQPIWLFLLSIFPVVFIGRRSGLKSQISLALYFWHTAMCIVIIYFVSLYGGDEPLYYKDSLAGITWTGDKVVFGVSTAFVQWFTRIFSYHLGFSYLSTFLVFNFIGSLGLLVYASVMLELSKLSKRSIKYVAWAAILLPSIGIWTSSIGKDAFSFLSIAIFLKASMCGRNRTPLIALAVLLMVLVRPHIGLSMLISWFLLQVFRRRFSVANLTIITTTMILAFYFVMPLVQTKLGLPDLSADSIRDFSDLRGRMAIRRDDAAFWYSQSIPVRVLMTAFYPTIFSASGILQYIVAIENVFLTVLFLMLCWLSIYKLHFHREDMHLWVYTMVTWVMLGTLMYNTGLAARQKWMFIPVILFLAMKYIGKVHRRKLR